MEYVRLEVYCAAFAQVLAQSKACAGYQAVDGIKVYFRSLACRVACSRYSCILQLCLGFKIPVVADVFFASVFGADRVYIVAVVASYLLQTIFIADVKVIA